jgi:hypothetical protein
LMIRSARCFGVYASGEVNRGGEPGALTGVAHSKQNFAPAGSCVPQFAHRRASGAAHSRQNFAWGGFSCWHRGHFIAEPPFDCRA